TSRPCSSAKRAVISDPDRLAASTTTTPAHSPEMRRLRRGKSRARGSCPNGISETRAPFAREAPARSGCSRGEMWAWPPAGAGVGGGKIARGGLVPERHLRDQRALRQDGLGKVGMLAGIDVVVAASEDGDGARCKARAVGGGVDAAHRHERRGVIDHLQAAGI